MVNININFKRKDLFLVSAIFVFLIGVGFVIAYNSSPANPSIMGHSLNEIELPSCTTGQVLQKTSTGNWDCGTVGGVTCAWSGRVVGQNVMPAGATGLCNIVIGTFASARTYYGNLVGDVNGYVDCKTPYNSGYGIFSYYYCS